LSAALGLLDGVEVVGEAGTIRGALCLDAGARASVALLDAGLWALGAPRAPDGRNVLVRRVPVIVMGMGDPAHFAGSFVAAGASGYWAKYEDLGVLGRLLRSVANPPRPLGDRPVSRSGTPEPRLDPLRRRAGSPLH
jgi:DNA-binding NarL/FixJ family response regulator